jgi:hypothetical protein
MEISQTQIWVSELYRVIHKSLRDFRLLRYSSRDGHAEGEHVNPATRVATRVAGT